MDNNIRIFHSTYDVSGFSSWNSNRCVRSNGNCTFVSRRRDDNQLDIAISFCHRNDTFKKKDGIRVAMNHLSEGNYITIPIGRNVKGPVLNDVIREFMGRSGQDDFRHLCYGTMNNIPIKDWEFVYFSPRHSGNSQKRILNWKPKNCQFYDKRFSGLH